MPKPIKWKELVRRLRTFGWGPPEGGGKHLVMRKEGGRKLVLPNPHRGDVDWSLTKRILEEAEISPDDWDRA
jgi:predicted RNA binding protein YcfA (HicA-like mRNA interferase family)